MVAEGTLASVLNFVALLSPTAVCLTMISTRFFKQLKQM
jgi:hypothetical protein